MGHMVQARRGLSKVFGFGLSMLLLAIASLVAIPSMVAASGPVAWGMIAAGQGVGAVASTAVAYGWGMSGPAKIAHSDRSGRMTEYAESVVCELIILVPSGLVAFAVAWLIGRDYGLYAGVGALSTATVGLTANWYFIGRSQPYALLLGETLPRIAGTGVGILLMSTGASALIGVLWQLLGMVAAFLVCTVWILKPWDSYSRQLIRRRPMRTVFAAQRHGVTATLLSSIYAAAPIAIVTVVAPSIQPVYAVIDKVQRQINVGLSPFTVVMQGWIPRAAIGQLAARTRKALLVSLVVALVIGGSILIMSGELVDWLGRGRIHPPVLALVLMASITAVYVFESVVGKAALPAVGKLGTAAKATVVGTAVGLPLVAAGAYSFGAEGALAGILIGIVLRLAFELLSIGGAARTADAAAYVTLSEEATLDAG